MPTNPDTEVKVTEGPEEPDLTDEQIPQVTPNVPPDRNVWNDREGTVDTSDEVTPDDPQDDPQDDLV